MLGSRISFDLHAFCALPLVRRIYQALVVGLAVFIVTLVVLRQPFRGYLAEVRISGPVMEGLDLAAAANWLKQTDSKIAVVTSRGKDSAGRGQIRATYIASRASAATRRLDELAERWLYQYLPNRLMAYRQSALAEMRGLAQAAREREDDLRARLEAARQMQLTQALKEELAKDGLGLGARDVQQPAATETRGPEAVLRDRGPHSARSPEESVPNARSSVVDKLENLRLALSELLSQYTEEHPQIITLKAQIGALEAQIKETSVTPEGSERHRGRSLQREIKTETPQQSVRAAQHFTSTAVAAGGTATSRSSDAETLFAALIQAGRERQTAEARLTERMHVLSNHAAAAQWSAAPAGVVTRLGGTPRLTTLALASLLAGVFGAVVFRAARCESASPKIGSAAELASAMELPVVGNLAALRQATIKIRRRVLTPGRLKILMHLGEAVIGLAVAACLVSIVVEPSLARQVLADPFGTLSEVLGRGLGG